MYQDLPVASGCILVFGQVCRENHIRPEAVLKTMRALNKSHIPKRTKIKKVNKISILPMTIPVPVPTVTVVRSYKHHTSCTRTRGVGA